MVILMGQYSRILFILFSFASLKFSSSSSFPSFSANTSLQLCSNYDRIALIEFKNSFSLNSDASGFEPNSYPKTKSWKTGSDCCSWDGVTCDTVTGRVTGLDLSSSWLQGSLYSNNSLFRLSHLQKLNLAANDFSGSEISSKFGMFESLTHLDLSSSGFSGQVPSEFSYLSKLISLDISDVKMEAATLRGFLQNCTVVQELYFYDVDMSSVNPGLLRNLSSSLTYLVVVGSCRLRGKIPENVFLLPNLQLLVLEGDYGDFGLSIDLPMSNWSTSLQNLQLHWINSTRESLESICNLTNLTVLIMENNNLHGSIPSSLSNLTELKGLSLSGNQLVGAVPDLSRLSKLVSLELFNNSLSGTLISSSSFSFPSLEFLYLQNNRFSGIEDFQSKSLVRIDISNNTLQGPIPSFVFGQINLTAVSLSSNNLTGVVGTDKFLKLKNLQWLDLRSNLLQGQVPVLPFELQVFLISANNFTGEIPTSICNMNMIKFLDISNNSLSGPIPECIGNLTNSLEILHLQKNSFHGKFPSILREECSLRILNLNGNQLVGPLSRSLENCKGLEILNLGNNLINDTFPHRLQILPELKVLVLKYNQFHGPILDYKAHLSFPNLRIFDISNNDFVGPLPTNYIKNMKAMMQAENTSHQAEYIGDGEPYMFDVSASVIVTMKGEEYELSKIIITLKFIDLSHNKFEGEVPKFIGNLSFLKGLNFSHNLLGGHIPSSMGNLTELEWLDLSCNDFVGKIPEQMAGLKFLSNLNLSHNKLVGHIPEGKQFNTFDNSSYEGNSGLCGFPLSKTCGNDGATPQSQPLPGEEDDSGSGLDWKFIMMGYSSGLVMGLSIGYMVLVTGKPRWLVRFVEGRWFKQVKRPNQRQSRRRR